MRKQEKLNNYGAFVEKFKPKKTTDDCYTPEPVYDAVKKWACKEYAIDPESVVRPFWPGGDYERFGYPDGCTVIDNPPFSILAGIVSFFLDNSIPFFLFCPALTAFSHKHAVECCHIFPGTIVKYENGAVVETAFVTSYGDDAVRIAPELGKAIAAVTEISGKAKPKHFYPDHVLRAASCNQYAKRGIDFTIGKRECVQIGQLDSQKSAGKAIYGGGLLLSEHAAAKHAAAKHAAAGSTEEWHWELSEREWRMVEMLEGR